MPRANKKRTVPVPVPVVAVVPLRELKSRHLRELEGLLRAALLAGHWRYRQTCTQLDCAPSSLQALLRKFPKLAVERERRCKDLA